MIPLKIRKKLKELGVSGFRLEVYEATSDIPRGETRSYKWIAMRIGRPKAYRAVGSALNRNRFPGIIPCHRVIRSDGSIGGYLGGIRAKVHLLRIELGKDE